MQDSNPVVKVSKDGEEVRLEWSSGLMVRARRSGKYRECIEVRNRGERCLEGRVYVNDYIVDGVWADYIAAAVKWLLRHYGTGVHEEDHAFKWLRAYVEDKLRLLPGIIEERIRRIIK